MKKAIKKVPLYSFLVIWALITVILLGWCLGASLSTTKDIFKGEVFKFSSGLHFQNYVKAWVNARVSTYFLNSLIYTAISIVGLIIICAPAAYVLARFKFFGNKAVQVMLAVCMGIPAIMIVLPIFSQVARMGILDNVIQNKILIIFLYIGMNIPFNTIFLITFFANIPRDFEEAAAIDGCSYRSTFWRIMFPMAQSGIITLTIFNFIAVWNEYFISLIFANSERTRPVAVGLFSLVNSMKYSGDWAGLFASVIIVVLPTLAIYIFLSNKIIVGITGGGIKG